MPWCSLPLSIIACYVVSGAIRTPPATCNIGVGASLHSQSGIALFSSPVPSEIAKGYVQAHSEIVGASEKCDQLTDPEWRARGDSTHFRGYFWAQNARRFESIWICYCLFLTMTRTRTFVGYGGSNFARSRNSPSCQLSHPSSEVFGNTESKISPHHSCCKRIGNQKTSDTKPWYSKNRRR